MDKDFKCKCGSDTFGHYKDFDMDWNFIMEYDYCLICNRAYDEEGNEIQEGEPNVEWKREKESVGMWFMRYNPTPARLQEIRAYL